MIIHNHITKIKIFMWFIILRKNNGKEEEKNVQMLIQSHHQDNSATPIYMTIEY